MKALPAIDLREGACVQLVGGDYDAESVRIPDVLAQAHRFEKSGFTAIHVVDLDAATGRGDNAAAIERLIDSSGLEVQVGGGVRDRARAEALLSLGAARVIVGTRAVEDRAFREDLASRFENKIVIAVDVRGTDVLVRGWQSSSGRDIFSLLEELEPLALAGVLVTAVHREGQLAGTDEKLFRDVAAATRHRVHASGGVTTLDDLRLLRDAGASAAVIGMALYKGTLDARAVAEEFGSW